MNSSPGTVANMLMGRLETRTSEVRIGLGMRDMDNYMSCKELVW